MRSANFPVILTILTCRWNICLAQFARNSPHVARTQRATCVTRQAQLPHGQIRRKIKRPLLAPIYQSTQAPSVECYLLRMYRHHVHPVLGY